MKQKLILLFFTTILLSNSTKAQQWETDAFLVRFDTTTTQAYIDSTMDQLNALELWQSPITQTRYWKIEAQFPFLDSANNMIYTDINDLVLGSRSRDSVDNSGLNFKTVIDPDFGNSGPPIAQCQSVPTVTNSSNPSIKVSILDTGIPGSILGIPPTTYYNYVDNNTNVNDDNGHGTYISSILANSFLDNSNYTLNQVAWDIRKTHDSFGRGYIGDILLAAEDATDDGANIINMSFSHYEQRLSDFNEMFKYSIEELEKLNVLIVASAGNKSRSLESTSIPVAYPSAFSSYNLLTVGAYDCEANTLASFSNYGKKSVDITAPGVNIDGLDANGSSLNYNHTSGTSQATAITTGIALALATQQSAFDYIEVKCAILRGAEFKSNLVNKVLTAGLIDGDQALIELNLGCSDIITRPVKTDERSKEEDNPLSFNVFPNPSLDVINIEFPNNALESHIIITDIKGSRIVEFKTNKSHEIINIGNLNPGFYNIQLRQEEIIINRTFVKI